MFSEPPAWELVLTEPKPIKTGSVICEHCHRILITKTETPLKIEDGRGVGPQLLIILKALWKASPSYVSVDTLVQEVYGYGGRYDEPKDPRAVLRVRIAHIRVRILKGSGWKIQNRYRIGYRLVPTNVKGDPTC